MDAEVFEDLERALDAALQVDLGSATPRDRRRAVARLGRLDAKVTALQAKVVGEFDAKKDWAGFGYPSASAGVREMAGVPAQTARRLVGLGRDLRRMPETEAALAAGTITTSHAQRLRSTATRAEFADGGEAFLLEQAGELRWRPWLKVVATFEDVVDEANQPDPACEPIDVDEPADHGTFHASATMDGLGELRGALDPVGFEAFEEALHRIERELFQQDWKRLVEEHGLAATVSIMPPPSQRRARALVEMAYRAMTAPADGKRPLPLVVIHTDVDTFNRELAGLLHVDAPAPLGTERLCELDSGTVIAPDQMIRWALHGTVRRLVYDSPSHVLDYGRDARLFTGKLREAIVHAARTCAAEGCEVRASRCEIDHVAPWVPDGRTEAANGRPLCTADHRARPGPP